MTTQVDDEFFIDDYYARVESIESDVLGNTDFTLHVTGPSVSSKYRKHAAMVVNTDGFDVDLKMSKGLLAWACE